MRVLFATSAQFLPQVVGGIETSTLELSLALKRAGHSAAVMCGLASGNLLDLVWIRNKLIRTIGSELFPVDRYKGIPVYRGGPFREGLLEIRKRFSPDAIVIQGGSAQIFEMAQTAESVGVTTFLYVHDIKPVVQSTGTWVFENLRWLSNSKFTQATLRERMNVESDIVPPLMQLDEYLTASTGEYVTLINPNPIKGGNIALDIAMKCPHIPFLFVEGWHGQDPGVRSIKERAAQIPNIKWIPRQRNMRKVYGRTRLLLAPSVCAETWCRVVTEGQVSGIPAVTSDSGALPDTVGPGGIVVSVEAPLSTWVESVNSMWSDGALYQSKSDAARKHARREELVPERIAEKFINVLS